jgi:hypothetical protein
MKKKELRCAVCGKPILPDQKVARVQLGTAGAAGATCTETWGFIHNDAAPLHCFAKLAGRPEDLLAALKGATNGKPRTDAGK